VAARHYLRCTATVPQRTQCPEPQDRGLWGWLTAFWSGAGAEIEPYGNPGGVVAVWGEEGADIDPFGNRSAGATPPAIDHGDAGATIDPYGRR
jgi:hypothetical protein